jgi:competence protein ComEA
MTSRDLLLVLLVLAIPALVARPLVDRPWIGPPEPAPRCQIPVAHPGRGVACVASGTAGDGLSPARLAEWEVPLDPNRASAAELASLDGIGAKLAERIRAARPFRSVEEVGRVRGVGRRRLELLRPRLRVSTTGQ